MSTLNNNDIFQKFKSDLRTKYAVPVYHFIKSALNLEFEFTFLFIVI